MLALCNRRMATDMQNTLRDQLSFYFSDANLRKDRFLLRLAGPRGVGEVQIRELASFNRVKALVGSDLSAVRAALRLVPGLEVSDDGVHVWRTRELPAHDDSNERTVYVEPLLPGTSRDAVQSAFGALGTVTYVSLPRLPSGELKGHAYVEFEVPDAAVAAAAADAFDEAVCTALTGAGTTLRVTHKCAREAMDAEYKRALEEGQPEAEARKSSLAAAAEVDAAMAAAAAEDAARRRVVKITGLPRGGKSVKAIRREMREVFGQLCAVEFVDYGISNSGDVSVGYVRVETPAAAAEAVRALVEVGQTLGGLPVRYELMRGEELKQYTEMIIELRHSTAKVRKIKRDKWWHRKHGQGEKGEGECEGEGAIADGEEAYGEAAEEEEEAGEGKRLREVDASADGGESKRGRVQ